MMREKEMEEEITMEIVIIIKDIKLPRNEAM